MENQFIFYFAAAAGVVVHFLLKIRDSMTKLEKFDWKRNLVFSGWVIVLVAVMVMFRLDFVSLLAKVGIDLGDVTDNKLLWFFIGYFGDSVWKNIENTGRQVLKVDPPTDQPQDPQQGAQP